MWNPSVERTLPETPIRLESIESTPPLESTVATIYIFGDIPDATKLDGESSAVIARGSRFTFLARRFHGRLGISLPALFWESGGRFFNAGRYSKGITAKEFELELQAARSGECVRPPVLPELTDGGTELTPPPDAARR